MEPQLVFLSSLKNSKSNKKGLIFMKRFFALFLCAVMMLSIVGCKIDYATEHEISKVVIHPSIISSQLYVWSEKEDINNFFNKFKLFDADFAHVADSDFDPQVELYSDGNTAEIQVDINNGEKIVFYITKDGTVYMQSETSTVYTDSNAINYDEMVRFLDGIK